MAHVESYLNASLGLARVGVRKMASCVAGTTTAVQACGRGPSSRSRWSSTVPKEPDTWSRRWTRASAPSSCADKKINGYPHTSFILTDTNRGLSIRRLLCPDILNPGTYIPQGLNQRTISVLRKAHCSCIWNLAPHEQDPLESPTSARFTEPECTPQAKEMPFPARHVAFTPV